MSQAKPAKTSDTSQTSSTEASAAQSPAPVTLQQFTALREEVLKILAQELADMRDAFRLLMVEAGQAAESVKTAAVDAALAAVAERGQGAELIPGRVTELAAFSASETAGASGTAIPNELLWRVRRVVVTEDKGERRERRVSIDPTEVASWKDYGSHVVVVTKDGQKFSSADAA